VCEGCGGCLPIPMSVPNILITTMDKLKLTFLLHVTFMQLPDEVLWLSFTNLLSLQFYLIITADYAGFY
jgi:hypothetical protein